MKILHADISMSARHSQENLDVSVEEKTGKQRTSQSNIIGQSGSALGGPTMWVDRVSISQETRHAAQFNFKGEIQSESRVVSADGATQETFKNKELVETLVGAVIDKEVTAGRLRSGQAVSVNGSGPDEAPGRGSAAASTTREWQMALTRTDIHYEDETMGFSSTGFVQTEDGRSIEFSLDLALERTYLSETEQSTLVHVWQEQVNLTDPLMVSLDGGLPSLSDTTFEFDLDGDGDTEDVHFAGHGTGFLAFDKNADGVINDGSELFGPGTGNGFGELSAYDSDGNNWIDENDAVFDQLSVWTRDENGEDRLVSLKEAGIGAIALDHVGTEFSVTDGDNNLQGQVRNSGVFLFENGDVGAIQQVDLAERKPEDALVEQVDIRRFLDAEALPAGQEGISITPAPMMGMTGNPTVAGPLEELMERIKELRRQINRLLGQDEGYRTGNVRSKRQSGPSPMSSYQLYRMITPEGLPVFGTPGGQQA